MEYLSELAGQLGVSLWILIVIFIWSIIWKLLALWKSARKGQIVWFILLAVINTIGILEILYIYVFSKLKFAKKLKKDINKKKRRK